MGMFGMFSLLNRKKIDYNLKLSSGVNLTHPDRLLNTS